MNDNSLIDDFPPYVEFSDLPNTTTPIDATNLNNLQSLMKQDIQDNQSIPIGGSTGQVLTKNSDNNYDIKWSNGPDGVPIGSILSFAGQTAPDKYLLCQGQEVSREDYSDLFSLIGTIYGEGDGTTTFNVPNLSERIPVGLSSTDELFNNLGNTGGEKEHTLTIAEMPKHNHTLNANANENTVAGAGRWPWVNYSSPNRYTNYAGEDKPHNNLQPYIVLNYIIKAING